jgi:CRISPR-associated protein Csb3
MSTTIVPRLNITVDVTNPGHFFACCGLLELASRLNPDAEGWFAGGEFYIRCGPNLEELVTEIRRTPLEQFDPEDATASPILVGNPFNLRVDWWKFADRPTLALKLWAGRMESCRIARAMQLALAAPEFFSKDLLNVGTIAYDPNDGANKVEPFYFDARRGPNAHSRDVGFSADAMGMTTTASPAVELLCLIGLQRCRPVPTNRPRVFDYHLWSIPLPPPLLPAATAGLLPGIGARGYRFESWFRTSQKKHKAFLSAQPKPSSTSHG